jgi:hypothetical protein
MVACGRVGLVGMGCVVWCMIWRRRSIRRVGGGGRAGVAEGGRPWVYPRAVVFVALRGAREALG